MAESELKYLDKNGLTEFWRLNKQYIDGFVNSKLFVGTEAQYDAIKDSLANGAMVILTDIDEDQVIDEVSLQTILNSNY